MEDRDEAMWAGLGSIDAFIDTSTPSPPSPTRAQSPSWAWERLPPPRLLQVRLDDGEPAISPDHEQEHQHGHHQHPKVDVEVQVHETRYHFHPQQQEQHQDPLSNPPSPDIDLLLHTLPVATGRVEKPLPHPKPPPKQHPSRVPLKHHHQPQPVLQPVSNLIHLPKTSLPPGPSKLHAIHRSPVRVTAPAPLPTSPRNLVLSTSHTANRSPPISADRIVAACSLKEKREREARQFPKEILGNLDGTTSAEVRKMNATQRELVLYKRKLRNRESARRSRQKRQATLAELQGEIDDLMQITTRMVEAGLSLHEENSVLREKLGVANAEIKGLRTSTCAEDVAAAESASPATVALKMKLGG